VQATGRSFSLSEKYQKINQDLLRTVSQTIPQPHERHFNLFGIDTTPAPRPFSHTLEDKTYIYYPNPIKYLLVIFL